MLSKIHSVASTILKSELPNLRYVIYLLVEMVEIRG